MNRQMKPSKESLWMGYFRRLIKRVIKVVLSLFILFLIVMGIIWAIPRVMNWALG